MYKVSVTIKYIGQNPMEDKKWAYETKAKTPQEIIYHSIGYINSINNTYSLRLNDKALKEKMLSKVDKAAYEIKEAREDLTKYLLRESQSKIKITVSLTLA